MCLQNLVKIKVDAKHQHELPSAKWSWPLNNKLSLYTYDPTALKQLRDRNEHDQWYKIMPFRSIRQIRDLGINRKINCKKPKLKDKWTPTGVNHNNLVNVKIMRDDGSTHNIQVKLATINIQ